MLRPNELITVKEDISNIPNPTYCFTWSNYKASMLDQMGELLRDEKFVDVTIYCESRLFKAHKLILCGVSPFLKNLLEETPDPQPCITVCNVPWLHLTWILQFIYSGQISIPKNQYQDFLESAQLLQISSLQKKTPKKTVIHHPRVEVPAKRTRMSTLAVNTPATTEQPDNSYSAPVFFRTQAVMEGLQQDQVGDVASGLIVAENAIVEMNQAPAGHHLEVQSEEIVEIDCSSQNEDTFSFNPPDTSCVPEREHGATQTANTTQRQYQTQMSRTIVLEKLQASTLKSSHSLAPKICNMCGKVYSNLSNLRQHISLVHTSHKTVQCPLCAKPFKSELYMRRHLICCHSVTPVKKDSYWRVEVQDTSVEPIEIATNSSTPQQIFSEVNAAVVTLTQSEAE